MRYGAIDNLMKWLIKTR